MRQKIKKSRWWIPALGVVIAYGFLHNCIIATCFNCEPVDWTNLILAFSIVIGLGGSRDIVLRKFSYLEELKLKENEENKSWLTSHVWIPFIGWCLVLGFANNFILVPYFGIGQVEWSGLMAALSILLAVSGIRDYGLYSQDYQHQMKQQQNMSAD